MIIGLPKEIKNHECRVGLTPDSVKKLISQGHELIVETDAGYGSGFSDGDYLYLGAKIVKTPKEVFDSSDLIVKVKEPQASEIKLLKSDQILFTYLHLAANKTLTQGLIESNAICIAYETVTNSSNGLPLLAPMSEVAGKISIQAGAHALSDAMESATPHLCRLANTARLAHILINITLGDDVRIDEIGRASCRGRV